MARPIKRKNKDGTFSFQIKPRRKLPDGTTTKINETYDTYDEAMARIDVIVGKVSGRQYVDRRLEERTSFRALLTRYRDDVTQKRPDGHPRAQELSLIRKWLAVDWADFPIVSVDSPTITEWRNERVEDGQAPSTVGNAMNFLSKVFKIASTEWGIKVQNPVTNVARPQKRPPRIIKLRQREEEILLRECGKGPWQLLWCAKIALLTGMRASEIRRIKRQHINMAQHSDDAPHGYVYLPRTKNGTSRSVPLVRPEAGRLFREILDSPDIRVRSDGFLFGDPTKLATEGGYTATMLSSAYADAVQRAAVSDDEFKKRHATQQDPDVDADFEEATNLTFHDLRHVALTRLAPYHRDALHLQRTSGHKIVAMLGVYFNPDAMEESRRACNDLHQYGFVGRSFWNWII